MVYLPRRARRVKPRRFQLSPLMNEDLRTGAAARTSRLNGGNLQAGGLLARLCQRFASFPPPDLSAWPHADFLCVLLYCRLPVCQVGGGDRLAEHSVASAQ